MINLKYADSMAKYLKSITSRDIKIYVTDPSMDNVEVSENDRENFDISSDETNAFNKDDLEKRNDESMVEDGLLKYDDSKDYKFEEIGLSDRYTFENFVAVSRMNLHFLHQLLFQNLQAEVLTLYLYMAERA